MNNQPQIYHGEWWVPAKVDPANHGLFPWVPDEIKNVIDTLMKGKSF